MAPKIKPQLDSFGSDYLYKRMNGDTNKKRLFCNRINYEKTLPLKKRLIPIEFRITKPRFKPMPYEKPITRSQQKQSSPSNTVNKENQTHSSDNQKVYLVYFEMHKKTFLRRKNEEKPKWRSASKLVDI